jgi:hypothetical protein
MCQVMPNGDRWIRVIGEYVLHRLDIVGELSHGGLGRFGLEAERVPRPDCPVKVSAEINSWPTLPFDLIKRLSQDSPQVRQRYEDFAAHKPRLPDKPEPDPVPSSAASCGLAVTNSYISSSTAPSSRSSSPTPWWRTISTISPKRVGWGLRHAGRR